MTHDPALDAIRQARRRISHDVDNDAARLIERYRQMQVGFAGRVIPGPESTVSPEEPTSAPGKSSTG